MNGIVLAIHIAGQAGKPLLPVASARAMAGRGLEGDRNLDQPGDGRNLTLIEAEALEALKRDYKLEVLPGDTRRNILTRGIALNHLVGREFHVGAVRLRGVELCEPCGYLAKKTSSAVSKALVHRGGLRCDVLTDGIIRVGDGIEA
jgi:MOSC domain-containing protein YiiM